MILSKTLKGALQEKMVIREKQSQKSNMRIHPHFFIKSI